MDKNSIDAIVEKLKELVAKGNVSRIVIKAKNGNELLNVPVNAGVVGGVVMLAAAKWVLIIGALTTVAVGCTVEVVKTNNEIINVVKPADGEKLKNAAVKFAGDVKDKVVDLANEAISKKNAAQDADVYEVYEEVKEEVKDAAEEVKEEIKEELNKEENKQ